MPSPTSLAGCPAVFRRRFGIGAGLHEQRVVDQEPAAGVCQVVSSTIVPGRYRRSWGTGWPRARTERPGPRSSIAPNTLGESGRGRHSHSTALSAATRQLTSQSERNP